MNRMETMCAMVEAATNYKLLHICKDLMNVIVLKSQTIAKIQRYLKGDEGQNEDIDWTSLTAFR